ncbi:MAG: hypothetical protein K6B43_14290 [Treponema sp.]|nr:hypothetical protein [Treponema sp.]
MITEKLSENYAREFISRTETILSQYNEIVATKLESEHRESEFYDVSLFINCLYGLLMMPSKLNKSVLEKYEYAKDFLSENGFSDVISFTAETKREINLEEFVRSIRNGMAHWKEDEKKELKNQGLDYEPKTEGALIGRIIIRGSFCSKRKTILTTTVLNIASETNRNKILGFLKFIYKTEK